MEVMDFLDKTFIITEEVQTAGGESTSTILEEAEEKEKASFGSRAFGAIRFWIETIGRTVAFSEANTLFGSKDPAKGAIVENSTAIGNQDNIIEGSDAVAQIESIDVKEEKML